MKLKTGKMAALSLAAALTFTLGAGVNAAYADTDGKVDGGGCLNGLKNKTIETALSDISSGGYRKILSYQSFLMCLLKDGNDPLVDPRQAGDGGLGLVESGRLKNFVWMNKGMTDPRELINGEIVANDFATTYPKAGGQGTLPEKNITHMVVINDGRDKYDVSLKADFDMDPVLAKTVVAADEGGLLDRGKTVFNMHYNIPNEIEVNGSTKAHFYFESTLFKATEVQDNNGTNLNAVIEDSGNKQEITVNLSKTRTFTLVAHLHSSDSSFHYSPDALKDPNIGNTTLTAATGTSFYISKDVAHEFTTSNSKIDAYKDDDSKWIKITGSIDGTVYSTFPASMVVGPSFPIQTIDSQDYMYIRFAEKTPVTPTPTPGDTTPAPEGTPAPEETPNNTEPGKLANTGSGLVPFVSLAAMLMVITGGVLVLRTKKN